MIIRVRDGDARRADPLHAFYQHFKKIGLNAVLVHSLAPTTVRSYRHSNMKHFYIVYIYKLAAASHNIRSHSSVVE